MPFGRVQLSVTRPDRVWQGGDRFDPGGMASTRASFERQPVEKGAGQPPLAPAEVFGVGGRIGLIAPAPARPMRSRRGPSVPARQRQRAGQPPGRCGRSRPLCRPDRATLNALQRRGHRSKTGPSP